MSSSNSVDEPSSSYCEYDVECKKPAMNYCQNCGQIYCTDHYLEHQKQLQEHVEHVLHRHGVLREQLNSLISQLSDNEILDLIEHIHEIQMESNDIEKTLNTVQKQLQVRINEDEQDSEKQLIIITNRLEPDQNDYLENDIDRLRKNIKALKLKIKEINNYNKNRESQEQIHIPDMNIQSNSPSKITKSSTLYPTSWKKKCSLRSLFGSLRYSVTQQTDDTATLSHLLLKQMSPSTLDTNENKFVLSEEEEEMIGIVSSNTIPRISQKIHLSNNIVRWLRGPAKLAVHGLMHAVDVCAQETHLGNAVFQAVKEGLNRQKQLATEQQTTNNSLRPTFTEITSDWTYEGENSNQGFSSPSIWMRDPQGRRILVKIQDHPLCAANEWLAYALGAFLGLSVNEVQIATYQNKLVTLHTDVTGENEKVMTFMDLPKHIRKTLLTDPTMQCMSIFDHIIQNVDRNQQNILITMSDTTDLNDDTAKFKVHLIDHSSCFGMGKLNVISIIASKFHSKHLAVVTFDPVDEARKFEQYLNKLSTADRTLIRKILNRFAAITDNQLDNWITNIQGLLSVNQYNRIHNVLYRQRDILRRYTMQWGISPRSSSVRPNEANQLTSEMNDQVSYL